MKVSYTWLQEHIKETLPTPEVLADTITFHAFEVEGVEQKGKDVIFDINVLPDRAGDCLSQYGVAREIAGLLGLTLKQQVYTLPSAELDLPIEIRTDLCRRYIAIKIDNVTVKESPAWLKEKLESLGVRSINNVVDATNYVMLDSGQPVHAFDATNIDGGIVVRLANKEESITTLSDEEKKLSETDIVIADYLGVVAIAGVKGGKTAEVTEKTTSVILEIGNFDPVSVRRTSRRLGLVTDASKRFENNFSPALAPDAAGQMIALIVDLTEGEVVGMKDVYPKEIAPRTVTFSLNDIARLIGPSVTAEDIRTVCKNYGYIFIQHENDFTLTVPIWREDIQGAHDIAEEIVRIGGYEKIAALMLPFVPVVAHHEIYEHMRDVKAYLVAHGFSEVMTYSFRKKGEVYVSYGPKDKSALRTSLSDGLKESSELNRLNMPLLGLKTLKIFEIGTVFISDKEVMNIALMDNGTLQELSLEEYYSEHKEMIEKTSKDIFEKKNESFKMWSAYPFIVRDVAVWVADDAAKKDLERFVSEFAKAHCARDAYNIDEFTKDGRISVAYRFIFQARDKTLTDTEVQKWWGILLKDIESDKRFEVR
jgi:phenylalanyl-tRNA synthetase beta chain